MSDQAEGLRRMAASLRHLNDAAAEPGADATPAFVVASGKGGVGKSLLAVLLARALAAGGRRVLLVDGAQNQGNLHVLLGARRAARLAGVHDGTVRPEQLLVPIAQGLTLLQAESGDETLYGLAPVDRARLHHRLTGLYARFDAVVVDAGAGIEAVVRVAAMRATRLLAVATPDPAALSDAYALVKILQLQLPSLPVDVIMNRVGDEDEARASFERLAFAAERFLTRRLALACTVPEDAALAAAVRVPGALLELDAPWAPALAGRLTGELAWEAAA